MKKTFKASNWINSEITVETDANESFMTVGEIRHEIEYRTDSDYETEIASLMRDGVEIAYAWRSTSDYSAKRGEDYWECSYSGIERFGATALESFAKIAANCF